MIIKPECYVGPEQTFSKRLNNAHRLRIPHPILSNQEMASVKSMDYRGWRSKTIDITFERNKGSEGLLAALDRICEQASQAIEDGYSVAVLSDREVGPDRVAISALLAVGAVHHHLVKQESRTQIGLLVETAEAREVHHHCLLVGYGADGINPYLAFESLWNAKRESYLDGVAHINSDDDIVTAYRKGVGKGS